MGAHNMKSNKVGVLTKDYNVHVAFMYWFIKYQCNILNAIFYLLKYVFGSNIGIENNCDPCYNTNLKYASSLTL
jgi:hypothetical protein